MQTTTIEYIANFLNNEYLEIKAALDRVESKLMDKYHTKDFINECDDYEKLRYYCLVSNVKKHQERLDDFLSYTWK